VTPQPILPSLAASGDTSLTTFIVTMTSTTIITAQASIVTLASGNQSPSPTDGVASLGKLYPRTKSVKANMLQHNSKWR
jgi:aspartate aminotransferase-like enzyme